MFELSIALRYLIPRRRQLSVSIISLISVLVIALVVWLIVVFFSVSTSMERNWIDKLTAMTAPVRATPTDDYYKSYFYRIDELSEASDYTSKMLGEKLECAALDPYDPNVDAELPRDLPAPDVDEAGHLRDPVHGLFSAVAAVSEAYGAVASEYATTVANIRLRLVREGVTGRRESHLSQTAYLTTFDPHNTRLLSNLLPIEGAEVASLSQTPPSLPIDPEMGYGVLVSKGLYDNGVQIGDRGWATYVSGTPSGAQEQRQPLFVAGFYDPGILPVGGRYIIAPPELVKLIHSSHGAIDPSLGNGVAVRLGDLTDARAVAEKIGRYLRDTGIEQYWNVETYEDYEFTRDVLLQLKSEKRLFSLLAMIIIIVACSNIVSMLIILVNDKRMEIGILRSMGASSTSIAAIFGFCGLCMGVLGSLIGTGAAVLTLRNLDAVLGLLGAMQGYDVFNSTFYGDHVAAQVSGYALLMVLVATTIMSVFAGLVPAVKACRMRPTQILRSEAS